MLRKISSANPCQLDENRPMVSIGMTVYNQENYVAQAIESILMQRVNFKYEIVIAEDCSTDKSREIVIDYANRYPEVIRLILQEKNVGLKAQSICLKKACKGIYRAQLEGDDFWLTDDKLQKQVDFLENNPQYIAVSGKIACVNEQNRPCKFPYGELTNIYCFEEEYTIDHFQKWLLPSHTGALLYRNLYYNIDPDFFERYESIDVMGDRKTALMLIALGKIHIMPETISVRRIALQSEANYTSNAVKVKPYATICMWMDRLEAMAKDLFGINISLQDQKRSQWIWALNNFAKSPTKANLRGLKDIFKISREKGRYIRVLISGLKTKTQKKIKREGFKNAMKGIIKFPFVVINKLLSVSNDNYEAAHAMNVISSKSVSNMK